MTDQDLMPFGKHKDEKMENVPARYLLWLRDEGCTHPDVSKYIHDNLSALLKECPDYVNERNK